MKKEKSVKRKLQNIRDSLNSSPTKSEVVVKGSKLLNTGQKPNLGGKTSKVMINPVPVQT